MDPEAAMELAEHPAIERVAREAKARLRRALGRLEASIGEPRSA
jgi:hypothetical protein